MPAAYKPRKKRNQKKSLPAYLWLLAGLCIGLFVAFIVYLNKQPATQTSFKQAVGQELRKLKQTQKPQNKHPQKKSARKKNQPPKYNFYTLLRGMEVIIPESETQPPKLTHKGPHAHSKIKKYILQIGSFQKLKEAEKLKVQLAFLGLQANIQHVLVNKQTWHRVRIGPYKNIQQLYRNQKILQKNDINAISMELK